MQDHLPRGVDRVGKAAPEHDRVEALLDLCEHEGREGHLGFVGALGPDDGREAVREVALLELLLGQEVAVVAPHELLGLPLLLEQGHARLGEPRVGGRRAVRALVQVVQVRRRPRLQSTRGVAVSAARAKDPDEKWVQRDAPCAGAPWQCESGSWPCAWLLSTPARSGAAREAR